jgi:uncharacterized protein
MLERTFLHLPGVGPKRELMIWRTGVRHWRDFLELGQGRLPAGLWSAGRPLVERCLACLERPGGLAELAGLIPTAEHWRFYPSLTRVVYLDIETGGDQDDWGGGAGGGLYDGPRGGQFGAGYNMWLINDAMKEYDVVVTFAGSTFDLPVLRQAFHNLIMPPVHIDLRWPLKRLGHAGGLKRIERRLGLARPEQVRDLSGFDALRLWQEHLAGSPEALATLKLYNAMDVINLAPLLKLTVEQMGQRLLGRLG